MTLHSTPIRALILEDVPRDADLMQRELRRGGIVLEPRVVDTREDFERELSAFDPQLILSDFSLPGFTGLDALAIVARQRSSVPVIVVTGSVNEETAVACMKAGAADYILKEHLSTLATSIVAVLARRKVEEEHERSRQATVQAAREWEHTFHAISDPIAVLEPDGTVRRCNQAMASLGGRSETDVVGRPISETIFSPHAFGPDGPLQRARRSMRRESQVMQWEGRWYVVADHPILDDSGRIGGFVHVMSDITDRKRAEDEIQRLAAAINQAAECVVITDPRGDIEYVNPAFEKSTGYSRDEVIGANTRILKSGQQEAAFYADLWQTIQAGHVWQGRFVNRRKNGELFVEEATVSPVFGPGGKIVNYVAIKRDITREELLERQVREAQKMQAVGRLAGGVAHDFNNLLTAINGYAEMVWEQLPEGDPVRAEVGEIREAGQRASNLTRQLLAFSRRQVLAPDILDLNGIVSGIEKLLRRLIGEDVQLLVTLAPDLARVKADPGQVEQVIVNLAVNARDAMPEGGSLSISTANAELSPDYAQTHIDVTPGRYVQLRVTDTGSGMDSETMKHVFEPFFTTKQTGTGLGLAVVYGIVKQSGGHIDVESTPGRGTTMSVYLPQAERPDPPPETAPALPATAPAGRETILIVEDNDVVANVVRQFLAAAGYHVLLASGPGVALTMAAGAAIDLLLTDVVMPGMSGVELAHQLAEEHPDMKVLYMSGYTDDVMSRHIREGRELNFIGKPFSRADILGKIRQVLDGSAG